MRYRNIKINYDGLRNILAQLDTYKRAVMQMIESMQAINQMLISSNDAVSILSLEDLYQNTKRSLLDCYNEIEALYRLLNDYVETMSELVDAKSGMTQVSRNDIYWNLQSMYKIIDDINSVEISNRLPSESGIGKTEEQKQAMKRNYQKIVNDIWCVCFPIVHTNILNCKNTLERYYTEKIVEYEETDDDYREKAMIFRGTYSGAIESGLQIYADIEQVKWDLLSGALGTVIGLLESMIYLTDITYTDGTELITMLIALTSSDPPLWAQELIKNEQDPYKLLGALLSDPVEVLESMLQGANDAYDENGLVYYIGAAVADILLGKAIAGALKGVKGASAMDEAAEITDDVSKYDDELADGAEATSRGGSDKTEGVGNPVKIEGRGSTGRTTPNTLQEQMAMHQVMSNPLEGATKLPFVMTDSRWPASEGWVKMQVVIKNADGTQTVIHYAYNEITGAFDDFKFK